MNMQGLITFKCRNTSPLAGPDDYTSKPWAIHGRFLDGDELTSIVVELIKHCGSRRCLHASRLVSSSPTQIAFVAILLLMTASIQYVCPPPLDFFVPTLCS